MTFVFPALLACVQQCADDLWSDREFGEFRRAVKRWRANQVLDLVMVHDECTRCGWSPATCVSHLYWYPFCPCNTCLYEVKAVGDGFTIQYRSIVEGESEWDWFEY